MSQFFQEQIIPENKLSTIITTVYNIRDYAVEMIKGCLNQTYKNLQIIVVDDCSTDGFHDYCNFIGLFNDKRIEYYKTPINMGKSAAINYALKNIRGDFISFTDGDDVFCPDKVEKDIRFLIDNNCDICSSNYILLYEDGRKEPLKLGEIISDGPLYDLLYISPIAFGSITCDSICLNKLIKLLDGKLFDENNGGRGGYVIDKLFEIQLSYFGKYKYNNYFSYYYRISNNQYSKKDNSKFHVYYKQFLKDFVKFDRKYCEVYVK